MDKLVGQGHKQRCYESIEVGGISWNKGMKLVRIAVWW